MTEQDSSDGKFLAEFEDLNAQALALGAGPSDEVKEPEAATDGTTSVGLPKRAPRKNLPFTSH